MENEQVNTSSPLDAEWESFLGAASTAEKIEYICSMRCGVAQAAPGDCQECGSALEPRTAAIEDTEPWDYHEWEEKGEVLAKGCVNYRWQIGDWLLEGENHIDYFIPLDHKQALRDRPVDLYARAVLITGLERNTLRDLASTARRFPRSERSDKLHWSHHRWLINLLPNASKEELRDWVDQAIENHYSLTQLKKAVRATKPRVREPIKEMSFRVTVPLRIYEALHDLARVDQSTLQAVASKLLTETLDSQEMQVARSMAKAEADRRLKERRRQIGRMVARVYDPLGLQR